MVKLKQLIGITAGVLIAIIYTLSELHTPRKKGTSGILVKSK